MLRLPDGMRDQIATAAKANGRSMNAEIVDRLQASGSSKEDLDTIRSQALHMASLEFEVHYRDGEIMRLKTHLALAAQYLVNTPVAKSEPVRKIIDEFVNYNPPDSQIEAWQAQMLEKADAMRAAISDLDAVRPKPPEDAE